MKYLDKESYTIEDVVIALYTYFPSRRGDIKDLKYTFKQPKSTDKSNYIYINGSEVILTFNDYKTQNKIGM